MTFPRSIQAEWLKTKRSAVLWLVLVGGCFIPSIVLAARLLKKSQTVLGNSTDTAWEIVFNQCWQYMSVFLLPIGITLACSLIAQIEFRNNTWKQLLTTPQSLTTIFFAKCTLVIGLMLLFFLVFNMGISLTAILPSMLMSDIPWPKQPFPLQFLLESNANYFVNCLPILAIQYWLSLHIRNFVIPIAIGFALLLASLMAMNTEYGYYLPYCYSSMKFLTADNKINPNANIKLWALAYFIFFTSVNYFHFISKTEGSWAQFFRKKQNAAILGSLLLLGVLGFWYLTPASARNLGSSPREVALRIKTVEENMGFLKYKVAHKTLTSVEERMKHYNIKGASIAVIHNYKIEWVKHYGWANAENKVPVSAETLFQPGSISKSVNAVAFMKLHEQKKINLFCDINNYLKTWKFTYTDSISKGKKITLAQLLSHSAGLNIHGFGFRGHSRTDTLPTIAQILNGEKPSMTTKIKSIAEPGKQFLYSGGGTMVSQQLLMDFTQQDYAAYMQQNVLWPMGMTNSFFTQPPPQNLAHRLATGYTMIDNDNAVQGGYSVQPQQAAAGLWTNATDLANFIITIQKALANTSPFLSANTAELMLTPYNDGSTSMGFFVEERNGEKYFQHGAGNPGFAGKYMGSLENGDGVVVLVNSDDDPAFLEEVIVAVAQAYEWPGFDKPKPAEIVQTIEIAPADFEKMRGAYEIHQGITLIDTLRGSYRYYAMGKSMPMYFTSASSFVNLEALSEKRFVFDAQKNVLGFELNVGNQIRKAQKLKAYCPNQSTLRQYLGQYALSQGEIDSVYLKQDRLYLYSENVIADRELKFLNDTDFYMDDGNIYRFVSDDKQMVKGITGKYNPNQTLIIRKI